MEGVVGGNGGFLWGLPALRRESGLPQSQLAEACGISQKQISRYEAFKARPHPGTLKMLAQVLKCRIKDLYIRHIEE